MLSDNNHFYKNYHRKNRYITVIYPEKSRKTTKTENNNHSENKKIIARESLVSWLFLIGSLMFLFDGLIELTEGISIHTVIHIVASVLFTIGSVLFIPTDKN